MEAFHGQLTQHWYCAASTKNNNLVQLQHYLLEHPETKNLVIYFNSKTWWESIDYWVLLTSYDSTQKALFLSHLFNVILHYEKPKTKYNAQFIIKRIINEKSLSNTTNMESSIMLPTTHFPPYHAWLQYTSNSWFHWICRDKPIRTYQKNK
jgi:hypothetical protein